jgi:hypothetical protein
LHTKNVKQKYRIWYDFIHAQKQNPREATEDIQFLSQKSRVDLDTGVLCREVKLPSHKVKRSPPPTADFKNEWSYTSNPPICL